MFFELHDAQQILGFDRLVAAFETFNHPNTDRRDWWWLGATLKKAMDTDWFRDDTQKAAYLPILHLLRGLTLVHTQKFKLASDQIALGLKAAAARTNKQPWYKVNYHRSEVAIVREYAAVLWKADRLDFIPTVVQYSGNTLQRVVGLRPNAAAGLNLAPTTRQMAAILQGGLADLPDPAGFFKERLQAGKSPTAVAHTALATLTALIVKRHTIEAYDLWSVLVKSQAAMDQMQLQAPLLARLLWRKGYIDAAKDVFKTFHRVAHGPLSTQRLPQAAWSIELEFYAGIGEQDEAQRVWTDLVSRFTPTVKDRMAFGNMFALKGDIEVTRQGLQHVFGPDYDSDHSAMQVLQRAYIALGDADNSNFYLLKITAIRPVVSAFEHQMRLYADQADTTSAISLFDKFVQSGLSPTPGIYAILLAAFSATADYENATRVFNAMVESGVPARPYTWSALVNAHIEADQFPMAAELCKRIPDEMYADQDVTTVILKAFVLVAAPIEQVERVFQRIEHPKEQAWALRIQSAADHRDMRLARAIFEEMDRNARADPLSPPPNIYVFSILLAAYLRASDRDSARAVYDAMIARNVVPSVVTYAIITNSYAKSGSENAFEQAHDFAMSVVESLPPTERVTVRGRSVESLYGPLIVAAGKFGRIDSAREYYELAKKNGEPSTILTCQLMNAYRLNDMVPDVYRLWLRIFRKAKQTIPKKAGYLKQPLRADQAARFEVTRSHNNAICIPLSIMIRALEPLDCHQRLKQLWSDVRASAFGFDAANYNHIAAALARCGDVESAFHIVDRVILPRQDEVNERIHAVMRQQDGLAEVDLSEHDENDDVEDMAFGEETTHGADVDGRGTPDAVAADSHDGKDLPAWLQTHSAKQHQPEESSVAEEEEDDYDLTNEDAAEPHTRPNRRYRRLPDKSKTPVFTEDPNDPRAVDLSIIASWRPTDIMWRPDMYTIATLSAAYRELQHQSWLRVRSRRIAGDLPEDEHEGEVDESNYEAKPEAAVEGEGGIDDAAETTTLACFGGTVVKNKDGSPKTTSVTNMVSRLNRKYARVVSLVNMYALKQKAQRLRANRARTLRS